jgi:hypothetical protein
MMIINMTHHQLQVWAGSIALATGAVALLMIIMSMVAGFCWRLFMITSGCAQSARKPERRRRRRMHAGAERVPLASLLDGGAGESTMPLEAADHD